MNIKFKLFLAFTFGIVFTISILLFLALKPKPETAAESGRKTYYPNTETLGSDEMRVISLGTGMPNQRKSQASACWLVELGNGDKFIVDIGSGSMANIQSLMIPANFLTRIFLTHLHTDHWADLTSI